MAATTSHTAPTTMQPMPANLSKEVRPDLVAIARHERADDGCYLRAAYQSTSIFV